jgi:hypothetical protein
MIAAPTRTRPRPGVAAGPGTRNSGRGSLSLSHSLVLPLAVTEAQLGWHHGTTVVIIGPDSPQARAKARPAPTAGDFARRRARPG